MKQKGRTPGGHQSVCLLSAVLLLELVLASPAQEVNTNAPTLVDVSGVDNRLQVRFSIPVRMSTATNLDHYSLTNFYGTVPVLQAVPGTNHQTVQITTGHQLPFMIHWLAVNGVVDELTGTNVIAPNSQISFTNVAFTTGYLKSEFYSGITGTNLSALTNNPNFPDKPNRVTYPVYSYWQDFRVGPNYGNRMSGILVPPVTGVYTFVIYSPGAGLLYLSTNESPTFKTAISSCQALDYIASSPINLQAGQRYYLESLTQEGSNPGDYAYIVWTTPMYSNSWSLISPEYLGNYLTDPTATIKIAHQPSDTTVYDDRHATFSIDAAGTSRITTNLTYQWQLNGADIPSATDASYTTPLVYETNSGESYRVLVYLPGAARFSSNAVLTVIRDLVPPVVVQALNFGNTNVQLLFSEEVEMASATDLKNYAFVDGLPITGAALDYSSRTVTLKTAPMSYGSKNTLIINGVQDQAMIPNTIATNTVVVVSVKTSTSGDVGNPSLTTDTIAVSNGIDVAASGQGIGGTADQFNLNWQKCAGDFDICVRVAGLTLSDLWAQAGLMARESLLPGSRFAAVLATPSMNGVTFEYRAATNASANSGGNFPANYPNTWLRLQRFGNYFLGYAGYDGRTWSTLSSGYITNLPSVLYVGLAVSSHDSNSRTLAAFRDWRMVGSDAVVGVVANPHEALGPSSRRTPIAISEIMYKPAPRLDGMNTEYLELYNSNPWFHDIGGYRITGNNMSYTVPTGTRIPAGGFLVLAASPQSLQSVYGITNVLGPYNGTLQKADTITLFDEQGAVLLTVPYSNVYPWPVATDGTGHSLVLTKPSYGEADPRAWDISDLLGGSPGAAEAFTPDPLRDVRINELLAHSEEPGAEDFIELYNHSTYTNDLSGCILTDNPSLRKFVIPPGTLIPPGGFISFTRSQFVFGLSAFGETVYLITPDGLRILDAIQYEAQADGVSFGRWPDGADAFYPLTSPSPGTHNGSILIRDIVINELMYDPISGNDDDQYIELYNQGTNIISLAGWQFISGITFSFPTNVAMAPQSYLVIARNRTNLFAKYPNLNSANTLGNFGGKLSHGGERIALAMPQSLNGSQTLYVVEDEVTYGVGGRWGQWSAGGGSSLELIDARSNHRLAANWTDSDDTQKSIWTNIETTGVLDNGQNFDSSFVYAQLGPLDAGECLVDNVEVHAGTGTINYVKNPGFENGLTDWSLQGCMVRSSLENTGYGGSGHSLHVRCSSRVWTGANSCQVALNPSGLSRGSTATLRFKARWLHGWPEVLLRLNGNWLEAVGSMPVPANLGTPGARNSRALNNSGPAIYEVTHRPPLPAYGQDVLVTARVHDPNGIVNPVLNYRIDPDTTYTKVPMKDDGTGGDLIAGDGLFSATIPGTYGIVAFYISAADRRGTVSRFPALLDDHAPMRECVVVFGDEDPGGSFASYHLWLTQTNLDRWSNLPNLSNEMIDGTFVNGNRIIYNMQARYAGSPYHQVFYSPQYPCHFKWVFPDDDKFLGATSFNKIHAPGNGPGDDNSLQREQTAYTFMRALGVPWLNRRYVAIYVNGYRSLPLMEDTQCPDADMVKEYFPSDDGGFLFKMQPWFEFSPFPVGTYLDFANESWCTIMRYTTTGNVKKAARYRYTFEMRRTPDSANNFSKVFSLVDAATSFASPSYPDNLENVADMENWMRVFAANHAAGNWDSFGTQNAQNLFGYVGTQGTRYSLLMFDFNIVLGNSGSWGPGENLFAVTSADSNLARVYSTPAFRRMYLRALDELVKGPLDAARSAPLLDAKYKAFVANGLSVENPSAIKAWLTSARANISAQISPQTSAPFIVGSPQVSDNLATIGGIAPVQVKTIYVNGVAYPVTWTSATTWAIAVPLRPGTNVFSVVGIDMHGRPIAGASGMTSAVFDGDFVIPQGQAVVNEIMYHPAVANAQYVELYNSSTNFTFDLSGWQIPELAYTFPPGSFIRPNRYLVLAQDRGAFVAAYGATTPVFDTFTTPLSEHAQTLTVVYPGTNNLSEIVAAVRYESQAPWPGAADGAGVALELLDPTRDNWRVGNWAASVSPLTLSPGAPNTVRTNLAPFPALWLNELQAENLTGLTNRAGQRAAWLEIFNPSLSPIPLDGLYLSDDYSTLTNWSFPPGSVISRQAFKIVFVDGQTNLTTPNEWHASFSLSAGSGSVALSLRDTNGIARVLDYLSYTNLEPDHSYGAYPDGQSFVRHELLAATPGASNNNASSTFTVAINEWMAGNTHTLKDPVTGKYDDWFELYNSGETSVNLTGCYLSHSVTNNVEFQIPAGYSLPAHGFLLVWADKKATNGTPDLHVNFKLSKTGTSICLWSPAGALLDYVSFGVQTSDISMGRYPDGSTTIAVLPVATPAQANLPPNSPPTLLPPGNKFVYLGQTLSFLAHAEDQDFPLQVLTYSLDAGGPTNASIDPLGGAFTWTPSARQAPSTNFFIIRATDNGIPPLSTSEPFSVIVDLPPLLNAIVADMQLTLACPTHSGQNYQLQFKDDLSNSAWQDLGSPFAGNGDTVVFSLTNDFTPSAQRFFRLRMSP